MRRGLVLSTAALVLGLCGAAHAETIEPNTTADVVAGDDHLCSLREAVTAAFTHAASGTVPGECEPGTGNDVIRLDAVRYELTRPGAREDDNVAGDLDIRSSLRIQGAGAANTKIDVPAHGDRVIEVRPSVSVEVAIDGVTITGGRAPDGVAGTPVVGDSAHGGTGGDGESGGGILNGATLTLSNSVVTDNHAGDGGAGGVATGANGANGGLAFGGPGTGGVGGFGGSGGGVASSGDRRLTVASSRISANVAGTGGRGGNGTGGNGIAGSNGGAGGEGSGGPGSPGGDGAGILSGGMLTLVDSTVTGNTAGPGGRGGLGLGGLGGTGAPGANGGDGGEGRGGLPGIGGSGAGLAARGGTTVTRSTIDHNAAGAGGFGGAAAGGSGGAGGNGGTGGNGGAANAAAGGEGGRAAGLDTDLATTVTNTTVTANVAGPGALGGDAVGGTGGARGGAGGDAKPGSGGNGGGSAGNYNGKTATLTHVTVSANVTGAGGAAGHASPGPGSPAGVPKAADPGLPGETGGVVGDGPTVLTNSIVASNSGANCSGTVTDGGLNLSFGDSTCPGVHADPELGPLQDNGGVTATQAIPAGSPAHDAVPAGGASCAAVDQRRIVRPQGPACDIGAFELAAAPTLPGGAGPGDDGADPGPDANGSGGNGSGGNGSDGNGSGPNKGPEPVDLADKVVPSFASATLAPKKFAVDPKGSAESAVPARAGKKPAKGTTIRYSLSEDARVVFTIERPAAGRMVGKTCRKPSRSGSGKRRCKRFVRVARFAQDSTAGANSKRFSGRVGRGPVKLGKYRITLVATDGARNASKPKRLNFTVVRG